LSWASAGRQPVAGFVLAGGESRRMGTDKALVKFAGGGPLIEHALGLLREAGLEARIAGARAELSVFAPVIPDANPGRGPLGGICAGLASCAEERAVFLPVDLPLLPHSLITFLILRAQISEDAVVVTSVTGFAQTFPLVVGRAALPGLEEALGRSGGGCFAALESAAAGLGQRIAAVPAEYLAQTGQAAHPDGLPPGFWFLNVNRAADLRRAEALLAKAR
jgi:molybdenum cofactor guanylyltransferase